MTPLTNAAGCSHTVRPEEGGKIQKQLTMIFIFMYFFLASHLTQTEGGKLLFPFCSALTVVEGSTGANAKGICIFFVVVVQVCHLVFWA